MAVTETLYPNGDGTTTGWARHDAGSPLSDAINDYPGPIDNDTTYVRGPNNTDANCYFDLTPLGAEFDPAGISLVQCKIAYRKEVDTVEDDADTLNLSVGLVQSDESTPLTDLVLVGADISTGYVETTVTLTSPSTGASVGAWNAGRLRIFSDYTTVTGPDPVTRLRVTAVQVMVTWGAASVSSVPAKQYQYKLRRL